jgi:hypothetical protein
MTIPVWAKENLRKDREAEELDRLRELAIQNRKRREEQRRLIRIVWPSQVKKGAVEHFKLKGGKTKTKPRPNGHTASALKFKKTWKIGDPVPEKGYTALSRPVFTSPQVKALNPWAKLLLAHMLVQYDGNNNGRLKCSFAYMKEHFGWASPNTLLKGRKALEKASLLAKIDEAYKGRAARYGLINCLVPKKGAEQ